MLESPTPVVFHDADYASTLRRIISFFVDLICGFALILTVLFAIEFFVVPREILTSKGDRVEKQNRINEAMKPYRKQSMLSMAVIVLAYHVLLRTSRSGTLGYRVTGIRLVNEFGNPPDMRTAGRRFMYAVPFCGCFGLSYLACRFGERRQAAHDQWAGTWVIRSDAAPAGPAEIEYHQKLLGTLPVRFKAVVPATAKVVEQPPAAPASPLLAAADLQRDSR